MEENATPNKGYKAPRGLGAQISQSSSTYIIAREQPIQPEGVRGKNNSCFDDATRNVSLILRHRTGGRGSGSENQTCKVVAKSRPKSFITFYRGVFSTRSRTTISIACRASSRWHPNTNYAPTPTD